MSVPTAAALDAPGPPEFFPPPRPIDGAGVPVPPVAPKITTFAQRSAEQLPPAAPGSLGPPEGVTYKESWRAGGEAPQFGEMLDSLRWVGGSRLKRPLGDAVRRTRPTTQMPRADARAP